MIAVGLLPCARVKWPDTEFIGLERQTGAVDDKTGLEVYRIEKVSSNRSPTASYTEHPAVARVNGLRLSAHIALARIRFANTAFVPPVPRLSINQT